MRHKKKPLIIYEDHRNILGIVEKNKARYRFFSSRYLTRAAKLLGLGYFKLSFSDVLFLKLLYGFLRILKPDFIIACNWITNAQKLYYEYARKNACRFVVVQHGSYVGGIVTVDNHKYLRCDKFLVWGEYFKKLFSTYNENRDRDIIIFGNSVYNDILRSELAFPLHNENILMALSFMDDQRLRAYEPVFRQLYKRHSNLFVKYHNQQREKFDHTSDREIMGNFASIADQFDLIIADHSTVLLDAVFFKKNVIYAKHDGEINVYDAFLKNHYITLETENYSSLDTLVDQDAQENLFQHMITLKDNDLAPVLKC